MPTPNTHELLRVVVSEAVGAPAFALPDPVAPIAPEPLVPDGSAPVNVTTVIDPACADEIVAVTDTLLRRDAANARQISAVPTCAFVRRTSCHVRPPPAIDDTTVPPAGESSAVTNASNSSDPPAVENVLVLSVRPDAFV